MQQDKMISYLFFIYWYTFQKVNYHGNLAWVNLIEIWRFRL